MCLVGAILPTTYILEINQYHTAEGFTGETSNTFSNPGATLREINEVREAYSLSAILNQECSP